VSTGVPFRHDDELVRLEASFERHDIELLAQSLEGAERADDTFGGSIAL